MKVPPRTMFMTQTIPTIWLALCKLLSWTGLSAPLPAFVPPSKPAISYPPKLASFSTPSVLDASSALARFTPDSYISGSLASSPLSSSFSPLAPVLKVISATFHPWLSSPAPATCRPPVVGAPQPRHFGWLGYRSGHLHHSHILHAAAYKSEATIVVGGSEGSQLHGLTGDCSAEGSGRKGDIWTHYLVRRVAIPIWRSNIFTPPRGEAFISLPHISSSSGVIFFGHELTSEPTSHIPQITKEGKTITLRFIIFIHNIIFSFSFNLRIFLKSERNDFCPMIVKFIVIFTSTKYLFAKIIFLVLWFFIIFKINPFTWE